MLGHGGVPRGKRFRFFPRSGYSDVPSFRPPRGKPIQVVFLSLLRFYLLLL